MLTNNLELMKRASREGFAIPAINTQGGNYDIIWACCKAAQEMRSPIILAHYVATGAYSGHDWFVQVARWCANKVDVPVSIHLDHGDSFETCMEMLKLGFTSLMIDGSTHPIEENAAMTNEVLRVAKCFGVPVEAEIGELLRLDNGVPMENKNIVDPDEVRHFLELCRPDTLAIGIGNATAITGASRRSTWTCWRRCADSPISRWCCTAAPAWRRAWCATPFSWGWPRSTSAPRSVTNTCSITRRRWSRWTTRAIPGS